MKERFIIGFIALVLGIGLTGGAFYLWQATKVIPTPQIVQDSTAITPTPPVSQAFTIDNPVDESVVDKRIIQVSGKSSNAQSIIISTYIQDIIVQPAADGSFSAQITLNTGANVITVLSLGKNGESAKQIRTVTFTTETF